jgi:hypothetical protein
MYLRSVGVIRHGEVYFSAFVSVFREQRLGGFEEVVQQILVRGHRERAHRANPGAREVPHDPVEPTKRAAWPGA